MSSYARRKRVALVASFGLLLGLLTACSKQGEGERCDLRKAGNSDCEEGLICVELRVDLNRCCPIEGAPVSDDRCDRSRVGLGGSGGGGAVSGSVGTAGTNGGGAGMSTGGTSAGQSGEGGDAGMATGGTSAGQSGEGGAPEEPGASGSSGAEASSGAGGA